MIQVIYGNTLEKNTIIVDPNRTLRSVMEEVEFDYSNSMVHLDGASIRPGDLDKSFSELGITEKCYLLAVVKAVNA